MARSTRMKRRERKPVPQVEVLASFLNEERFKIVLNCVGRMDRLQLLRLSCKVDSLLSYCEPELSEDPSVGRQDTIPPPGFPDERGSVEELTELDLMLLAADD